MKRRLLTSLALLAAGYHAAAQAGPTLPAADKAAIEATLARFAKNQNDHQFAEMATYATPDFSFVNVVGMYWQGEPTVQQAHQAVFDRLYKGVVFPPIDPATQTFRAITPDVVLVTSRIELPTRADMPQTAVAGSRYAMFSLLLVKRQGRWLLTAGQNTPVDARAHDPAATPAAAPPFDPARVADQHWAAEWPWATLLPCCPRLPGVSRTPADG